MSRWYPLLLVLLILSVVGVACAAPTPQPAAPQEEAKPAEAQPAAAKEIVVGAIYPLSGSLAATGVDLKNAVELATDIVNNKYDLNLPLAKSAGLPNLGGAKIRLVFGDHEADPEKGSAEAERLITTENVVALVGSYNSAVTATASQVAERQGVPFLNPESTSPTLTERGFQWFFRTTPFDKLFAENFYQFLDDMKAKGYDVSNVAILNENTLWGTDVNKLESQFAEKYGYNVVANIPYEAKASDVSSEVQKLKAAGDAVLLQSSYVSDAILYMQTYKQLDYAPTAIIAMDAGFVASEFVQTLGDDANYILSREVWALDLAESKPIVKAVNDLYKERYGTNMNGNSARSFTGMLVLADAINRAGSTKPEAIQKALMETNIPADQIIMPWKGIKFDPETHQNILGSGIIVQIQDGEYKTVWPFDLASADIVWPFPKWSER